MLIDTHCHLHDPEFFSSQQAAVAVSEAVAAGVERLLCVGTSLADSERAVQFARLKPQHCWAAIGIHPHEAAKLAATELKTVYDDLAALVGDRVVAVGECGLDFHYHDKPLLLKKQTVLLESQLQLAVDYNLPVSFHVRSAFDDFWPILNNFPAVRGVLHSFTDSWSQLEIARGRNLLIGVNGIASFTKDYQQIELFKKLPLDGMLLETDAPFLTPTPLRGTINAPKNVTYITDFLAELRGENADIISRTTTKNARSLFGF